MANRLAHYLHQAGYRKGDSVAVCLENRLEYTAVWMGCAKVGVVPALININIRGKVLAHKLEVAKAKGIIFSNEMEGSEFYSLINFKAVCFRVLAGEVSFLSAFLFPSRVDHEKMKVPIENGPCSCLDRCAKVPLVIRSSFFVRLLEKLA